MLVEEVAAKRAEGTKYVQSMWNETHLLDGTVDYLKPELAMALENQRLFNENAFKMKEPTASDNLAMALSLPIITRVFNSLVIKDLVSIQTLAGPTDVIYYLEKNELIDDNGLARTRKRKCALPWRNSYAPGFFMHDNGSFVKGEVACPPINSDIPSTKWTPSKLEAEIRMAAYVANSLVDELQGEIIKNMLDNSLNLEVKAVNKETINLAVEQVRFRKGLAPNWIMFSPKMAATWNLKPEKTENNLYRAGQFNDLKAYIHDGIKDNEALLGFADTPYRSHFYFGFYIPLLQVEVDGGFGLMTRGDKKLAREHSYVTIKGGE
jgi:hypothetical protein